MNTRFLQETATRRAVLGAGAGLAVTPRLVSAQVATPVASPVPAGPGGWFSYGADLTGAKAVADGLITSANVTELGPAWRFQVGGPVSSTPVISGGVAYVGSYDGNLYAIDTETGAAVWTYASGADVMEPNLQVPLGITGSAHIADGVVYVGDSAANVHAIDASTGDAIWTVRVDEQEAASIWSSPVVFNGVVYLGVASIAKEAGFRGSVVALDAATGESIWETFVVPEDVDGAGVFAVPAIDTTRGVLYVGTQNAYTEYEAPFGYPISLLAIDIATGEVVWAFLAPPNDGETSPTEDVGFSASPNLFTAEIDGTSRDLVGVGQKSGQYYALDRETGALVWSTTISPAGFLGGMEGTAAAANGVIAIPATDWPEFEGPASGLVSGVDWSTGEVLWTAEQSAPAASPAAISNDVVFHAGFDGILHAYALADGTELWSADLGASVSGGVAVAEGYVIVGAATPQFAPFITPGDQIHAFAIGAELATPEASPNSSPAASPES